MKFLKTYEETINNIIYKYDEGDYVLLNKEEMDKNTIEDNVSPHDLEFFDVKIIKIRTTDENGNIHNYLYPYIIETYNNVKCSVKESEIIRKLTDDEIKEYNLKKQIFKYNI